MVLYKENSTDQLAQGPMTVIQNQKNSDKFESADRDYELSFNNHKMGPKISESIQDAAKDIPEEFSTKNKDG